MNFALSNNVTNEIKRTKNEEFNSSALEIISSNINHR